MNKRELIARVQRHMGIGATRDAARAALNAVLESIQQAAAEGETVHIPRLGSFEYRLHHPRSGKGLPTAAATEAPPTRRLTFRPANRLRECMTARANAARTQPPR